MKRLKAKAASLRASSDSWTEGHLAFEDYIVGRYHIRREGEGWDRVRRQIYNFYEKAVRHPKGGKRLLKGGRPEASKKRTRVAPHAEAPQNRPPAIEDDPQSWYEHAVRGKLQSIEETADRFIPLRVARRCLFLMREGEQIPARTIRRIPATTGQSGHPRTVGLLCEGRLSRELVVVPQSSVERVGEDLLVYAPTMPITMAQLRKVEPELVGRLEESTSHRLQGLRVRYSIFNTLLSEPATADLRWLSRSLARLRDSTR